MGHYDIDGFVSKGWLPIETDGSKKWAWSKKEAFLIFPANHSGISLEFSACPAGSSDLIIYHKGNEIRTTGSITAINVPAGITSCRINLDKLWIPKEILGLADERPLGVCLHKIGPLNLYSTICNRSPYIIEMGLSGICNIEPPCVMCANRNSKFRIDQHLPQNIIDKMRPYLNYAEAVSLHGVEGETLLHPKLLDILSSIDTKLILTVFSSNGLLLTKEISEKLIAVGLREISISIDAANPDTYYKIRNNDGFHIISNNIKQLVNLKKEQGVSFPNITISMAIMKENYLELPEFIDLAHELEASKVQIRLLVPLRENYEVNTDRIHFNYYEQRISPDSDVFKRMVNIAKIKAKQYGITLIADNPEIIALLGENSLPYTNRIMLTLFGDNKDDFSSITQEEPKCTFPWKNILIDLNGDIRFCCHSRQVLGNLNEEDLSEIWNGKIAQDNRRDLLRNEIPEGCLACPRELSQYQIWQNVRIGAMDEKTSKTQQIISAQEQQINDLTKIISGKDEQINCLNQELKLKSQEVVIKEEIIQKMSQEIAIKEEAIQKMGQEISYIYDSQTYRFIVKPFIWPLFSFIKRIGGSSKTIYSKLSLMNFSFEKMGICISRFYANGMEAVYKGENEYFVRLGNKNFEEKKVKILIDIWPYTNRSHPKRHFCYFDALVLIKPMCSLDIKVSYDWETQAKFFVNGQEWPSNIWRGVMVDAELYMVELVVYDLKNHILDRLSILQRLKK